MEALTLTHKIYDEAIEQVTTGIGEESYLSQFEVTFPDGINTAEVLEICRVIQSPTMDNKIRLMKICIAGRNVQVKCPNGEVEKFCMTNEADNFDAFPLFVKDPLALLALADTLYGYILKKYVRLSKPKEAAAGNEA